MELGGMLAPDERFCLRGVCLEDRYTGNGIEGSNPSLSVLPMASLDRHLLPGEQIVHRARPHWVMFLGSVLLAGTGIVLGGVLQYFVNDYWYAGAAVAALGVVLAIGPALRYAT